jgi:lipoprotein LprG
MRRIHSLLAFVILAGACGSSDPEPVLSANIDEVLAASATAMGSVDTVRFEIERGGEPIYIDDTGTLEFKDAVGRFVAPQKADAVVKVGISGLNVQIGAIAIDGIIWLSNPISGKWEQAPSSYEFDPTTLFSPEVGWRPLLDGELQNAVLVGLEERDDEPRYHVTGSAPAVRIEKITAGLVTGQDVDVDLWLDPDTGHVLEVTFDTETVAGVSTWELRFFDYGDDLKIVPPEELVGSG